jgi:hypothetical protein
MDNKELSEIFAKAGEKNGYTHVKAVFMDYADLKVTWARTYEWADFKVSDYLDEAPRKVIEATADTMFLRIRNLGPKPGEPMYPKAMNDYILSEEFRKLKAGVWAERHEAKEILGLQEKVEGLMEDNHLEFSGLKVFRGKKIDSSPLFRILVLPKQTPDDRIIFEIEKLIESMEMFKN